MVKEKWTMETIAALPVTEKFTYEEQVIDGQRYRVAKQNDIRIVWLEDDEAGSYMQGDRIWTLCQLPDGTYARYSRPNVFRY